MQRTLTASVALVIVVAACGSEAEGGTETTVPTEETQRRPGHDSGDDIHHDGHDHHRGGGDRGDDDLYGRSDRNHLAAQRRSQPRLRRRLGHADSVAPPCAPTRWTSSGSRWVSPVSSWWSRCGTSPVPRRRVW